MRALIAEDNPTTLVMLEMSLTEWGFEAIGAGTGTVAWNILQGQDAPPLVILDWAIPEIDGLEICRRLRQTGKERSMYIILLTGRGTKDDLVEGLRAGADDYVIKPFDPEELHARVQVGERIIGLQRRLADHVVELEQALARVKQLHGLLPICAYCKKIRDDQNYWQQVEAYITARSEAHFSHGVCPECYEKVVKPELEAIGAEVEVGTPQPPLI